MHRKDRMQKPLLNLTHKETEVLRTIANIGCYKKTCEMLHISPSTLNKHLGQIRKKLNVDTTPQVVHRGMKKGIIS